MAAEPVSDEPEWVYPAEVLRWVDGDTVDLRVILEERTTDHGFHVREERRLLLEGRFRLYGVDTPERGAKNYAAAREFDEALAPAGAHVTAQTFKAADKYGRWLALLTVARADGTTAQINAELVENKMAVPYFGGRKG